MCLFMYVHKVYAYVDVHHYVDAFMRRYCSCVFVYVFAHVSF